MLFPAINPLYHMYSLPAPALVAALAAAVALPFSLPAAGMLALTAGLGVIVHQDYVLRCRRVRLPRKPKKPNSAGTQLPFRGESQPLAA